MIQLRTFGKKDYDALIGWIKDAEMLMQVAGTNLIFPLTPQQLDEVVADEKRFSFAVTDATSGISIGHSEIYLTDTSALLGKIVIGEEQWRRKGLGQQIVDQLLEIAFNDLRQDVVELNVFDWNVGAIKCYEKCGFTIKPNKKLIREINGKTWIAINMTIRKDVWQSQQIINYTSKLINQ